MNWILNVQSEVHRAKRLLHGDHSLHDTVSCEPVHSGRKRFFKPGTFRRAEAFESDYPAFLLALASAIRTGLDPVVALCRTEKLFDHDSLLGAELKKSREEIEQGIPEDTVLGTFASNIHHPDIDLFRVAFILSRQQGSSLSPCLHRLVKVTRQRQSFRRKTAAAVAMQRLSAFGIAVCAFATGSIQFLSNPSAFQDALTHPFGSRFILLGAVLMVSGIGWMLFLTRRRV